MKSKPSLVDHESNVPTLSVQVAHWDINDLDDLLCFLTTKGSLTQDQGKEKYDQ